MLICRAATPEDAPQLARWNQQLIRDEGHRNPMSREQLEDRMRGWLAGGEYEAVLLEQDGAAVGYGLFRREPEYVFLRQFFVVPERRRQGIGRAALDRLRSELWRDAPRVRIDVLIGNAAGIAFWRAVGFHDDCLTMEWSGPPPGERSNRCGTPS